VTGLKRRLEKGVHRLAPAEMSTTKRLSPSKLLSESDEDYSDAPLYGLSPRMRGIIIHQLLEILPEQEAATRHDKAQTLLNSYGTMTPESIMNSAPKLIVYV